MKILGLDIGTTSIGWAIITENEEIIKTGVHIFPVGVRDDKFLKSGTEESKNVSRRTARMARRLLFRYKLRRAQLKKILLANKMMPEVAIIKDKAYLLPLLGKDLYHIRAKALDGPISLNELGRIFLHLNQRRGFKSGRKTKSSGEDETGIKAIMGQMDKKIEEKGCRTLGEYFYSLYLDAENEKDWHNPNEPTEQIRNRKHKEQTRYVFRATYEKEFDLIWEKQKEFHPLLTDELKTEIKDRTIFYQRPLKSAKHLVSKCPFFPKKRVIPKSHPLFLEFRNWQTLCNLRITVPSSNSKDYRANAPLTIEEKHTLAELYQFDEKPSKTKVLAVLKTFGIGKEASFNAIEGFEKGNSTIAQIAKALGKERVRQMSKVEIDQIWHVLYCANEDAELHAHLVDYYGFSFEEASGLISVDLVSDYGSLSRKALEGILAHMKEGMDYAEACLACGFHHSYDAEANDPNRVLVEKLTRTKDDDLRNPLVNKVVSEVFKLTNALMARFGRPDTLKIEFARSLQKPKQAREKELNQNREKKARREGYYDFLKEHPATRNFKINGSMITKFELFLELEHCTDDLKKIAPHIDLEDFKKFAARVNPRDGQKYNLWLECGRVSPYTNQVINLTSLFSPEIEVEHILPYSISQDNSFVNLTLAERTFNDAKGNRSPMDFFKTRPEHEMIAFKKRIEKFGEGKKKRFLFDGSDEEIENKFRPDALASTAYITRVVRKKLLTAIKNVETTNGQATSLLRDKWGLNEILNPKEENKKTRDDHRHHAIDALVVACTTRAQINKMSREASFDHRGKMRIENFPAPMERFHHLASESIAEILVSYRKEGKLLSSRPNKYQHSHSKNKKPATKNIGVRGSLHEETNYGQITNSETGLNSFVVRKAIAGLKVSNIGDIVDKAIRTMLFEKCAGKNPTDLIGKLLPEGIFMPSKKPNIKVPIYNVRVAVKSNSMIQIRTSENEKLFVEPGSNYGVAFYKTEKGDIEELMLSFFQASQNVVAGMEAFPEQMDGKRKLFSLQINDLVLIDASEDEIREKDYKVLSKKLFRVQKVSKNDYNFRHHLASRIDSEGTLVRLRSPKQISRIVPVKIKSEGVIEF